MASLSRAKLNLALSFIRDHGREIDQSLAGHLFGDAPVSSVYTALATHQNRDGGFGHGLEPDFLLPDSSPMATTVALQILAELQAPADHPLVLAALDYLARSYDEKLGGWLAAPSTVNNYPHAPWWAHDPARTGRHFALNPGAEIVGYFMRWRSDVPTSAPVTVWFEQALRNVLESAQIEPHELLCCVRLAETPGVERYREQITQRLVTATRDAVQTDPTQWKNYCIKPLTAAPRPDSLLCDTLSDAIAEQLDFEIAQQQETGAWEPHWSWFGNYPSDWARVQPGICAHVTLETLRALRAWGRM